MTWGSVPILVFKQKQAEEEDGDEARMQESVVFVNVVWRIISRREDGVDGHAAGTALDVASHPG
jgi:hypothetical protein